MKRCVIFALQTAKLANIYIAMQIITTLLSLPPFFLIYICNDVPKKWDVCASKVQTCQHTSIIKASHNQAHLNCRDRRHAGDNGYLYVRKRHFWNARRHFSCDKVPLSCDKESTLKMQGLQVMPHGVPATCPTDVAGSCGVPLPWRKNALGASCQRKKKGMSIGFAPQDGRRCVNPC